MKTSELQTPVPDVREALEGLVSFLEQYPHQYSVDISATLEDARRALDKPEDKGKIVIEGRATSASKSDGGAALIVDLDEDRRSETLDDCFFVKLQSWDETFEHRTIRQLEKQRLRVTVEVLEEPTKAKAAHPIETNFVSTPHKARLLVDQYVAANPKSELTGWAVFRWCEKEYGQSIRSKLEKSRVYAAIRGKKER